MGRYVKLNPLPSVRRHSPSANTSFIMAALDGGAPLNLRGEYLPASPSVGTGAGRQGGGLQERQLLSSVPFAIIFRKSTLRPKLRPRVRRRMGQSMRLQE
jgi:hypothetical protein